MQKHAGLKMKQKGNVCDIGISNMMSWKKMSAKAPQRRRCWNLLPWIMLCLTGLTGITWISLQVLWGFGRALTGISNESDIRVWRCSRRTSKSHWTLHKDVCYLLSPLRGDGGQVPIGLFMSCCPVAVFHSILASGCKNDHMYLPRLDLQWWCFVMKNSVNKPVKTLCFSGEMWIDCLMIGNWTGWP